MTLDELLTWPLHKRVEWLRRREGSHDKLAARLGTNRQTVIGWEKGSQPNRRYRSLLAEVSGFPEELWQRTPAEQEIWGLSENRLRALEAADAERQQEIADLAQLVAELTVRVDRLEGGVSQSEERS